MSKDNLGDRIKSYECNARFMPQLPIIIRIDGKCFSRFTNGLERPYDQRFIDLMVETTKFLVQSVNAKIGYTQSDEISLVVYEADPLVELPFGGKKQKLISILASEATAKFNKLRPIYLPDYNLKTVATFDCRAFQVPTTEEAANAILWREQDATKNAVSMAARAYFSHNEIMGKNSGELQEMLWSKCGINFNDYPTCFKRGTFVRRQLKLMKPSEMNYIPEKYRPTTPIKRHVVDVVDMPIFSKVNNRVDVVVNGADPNL
jgi:tRNA(His) 5'-end guanylyltransferase